MSSPQVVMSSVGRPPLSLRQGVHTQQNSDSPLKNNGTNLSKPEGAGHVIKYAKGAPAGHGCAEDASVLLD